MWLYWKNRYSEIYSLGRGADLYMAQLMQLNMILQLTRLVPETD